MSVEPTETENSGVGTTRRPAARAVLFAALAVAALLCVISVLAVSTGSTSACGRCHVPQASSKLASVHSNIPCQTCHFALRGQVMSRLDVATRMRLASFGGMELDGPARSVGRAVCLGCHDTIMNNGIVEKDGLRISHKDCAATTVCETCHGQAIHPGAVRYARIPSMADCVACHVARSAPLECSTCHRGKLPSDRIRDPEWARAHGPNWKTEHGTGDLRSCTGCHATAECRKCHLVDVPHPANFGSTHGKQALKAGRKTCLTCHKKSSYCDGCHETQMPHPDGFLRKHSRIATSATDPKCVTCHVADDCETCHTYHIHPGGTQPPVGRLGGAK